jgi:dimethylglycine dehydrogenase
MVPKPGRIGLGYFADAQGRIVTEMSLMAMERGFLLPDHRCDGAMA